ncbi:hypothetical protein [Clostridium tarantellae]|uniref:DUF4350 domain-containing protein n=1 Tax=Clostridium tarantellae TaxID=39493 RepID=A0A6I1MKJ3_9CLOT|nr:hypothetical protein [Clostridium tarantellae]MPQ42712.1 hypothetical protein [Clostridium tarantellae]
MKKIIKLKIMLIMFISIAFSFFPIKSNVLATENLEVSVQYGIGGKYNVFKEIPISVEVKNNGEDFIGELQIEGPGENLGKYNLFSKQLSVQKDSTKKLIIPVKINEESKKLKIKILRDDKLVLEKPILIDSGRSNYGEILTGVLTDDFNSLSYFGGIKYGGVTNKYGDKDPIIKLIPLEISPEIIGDNNKNIATLDMIIINNYDTSKLTESQYNSLKAWIEKGGTLILGTGVNNGKTLSLFNEDIIKGVSNNTFRKDVVINGENLALDMVKINTEEKKIFLNYDNVPIISSESFGSGNIVISSYDLGIEPMVSFSKNNELWSSIIKQLINKNEKNFNTNFSYQMPYTLSSLKNVNLPSLNIIILIFIFYVIVVGLIAYLILKKINKRELFWFVAPILSVMFGAIIFIIGSNSRVNDVVVNNMNIVETDELGNGIVNSYMGISNSKTGNLYIKEPEGKNLDYITESYYGGAIDENKKASLELKTVYEGNGTYYEFYENPIFKFRNFKLSPFQQKFNVIEQQLSFEDGKLKGKIKNTLGIDIEKLILVCGNRTWDLGSYLEGEEKQVPDNSTNTLGMGALSHKLMDEYYKAKYEIKNINERKKEFKNIGNITNILNILNDGIITKDLNSKLIAITNLPIDNNITLGTNSISQYNTTILSEKIELNFENKDGKLEFPLGYFPPDVESQSGNGGYNDYEYSIHGNTELILKYNIDKSVNIEEITIDNRLEINNNSNYGREEFKGKCYLFNVKKQSYEEIELKGGKKHKLKENIEEYLEDNLLTIKILGEEENSSPIPQIQVKGSAK